MHPGGPNPDKAVPLVFPGRARVGNAAKDRGDEPTKSRTLRAAACVGLLASVLLTAIFLMLSGSLSGESDRLDVILQRRPAFLQVAAGLVPFAAIGFLWFMGAVRDRIGEREDRLFSTLLVGSGLLFLSGLFVLAAVTVGLVTASQAPAAAASDPRLARFVRAAAYNIAHEYIVKTSIVFIIATSTLILRTGSAPRPFAFAGYTAAIGMLFGGYFSDYVFLAMPLWIALISLHMLFERSGRQR